VRDEKIRRTRLLLNVLHQVNNLSLDGYVQCAYALVRNNKLGVHNEGAGDADALALTSGKLVRLAFSVLGSQPDLNKNVGDLLLAFSAGRIQAVYVQSLRDDVLNLFSRV